MILVSLQIGQQLTYISVSDIAYFYSEDGVLCVRLQNGKRHILGCGGLLRLHAGSEHRYDKPAKTD